MYTLKDTELIFKGSKLFTLYHKLGFVIFSDSFEMESKTPGKDVAVTQKQQNYLTISSAWHSTSNLVLSSFHTLQKKQTHTLKM